MDAHAGAVRAEAAIARQLLAAKPLPELTVDQVKCAAALHPSAGVDSIRPLRKTEVGEHHARSRGVSMARAHQH
jgi:hypothetical protein